MYLVINFVLFVVKILKAITKARNDESAKKSQEKFCVFQLSCFRDNLFSFSFCYKYIALFVFSYFRVFVIRIEIFSATSAVSAVHRMRCLRSSAVNNLLLPF